MTVELPPVLFYGLGLLLIVFGTLRAHHFGWQRRQQDGATEVEGEREESLPRPSATARRHLMFGVLWVLMGLFLVVSTYVKSRR
jgi:hypothetical protein